MTLADLRSAVAALSPSQLDNTTADNLINRVYFSFLRKKAWIARRVSSALNTQADKTTGTVTITNGSTSVQGNGTAFAASDAGRYLYISDYAPARIATFVAASGAGALTLSSAWGNPTVTAIAFKAVSLRYTLPSAAERVMRIATHSWPLTKKSRRAIDALDPYRRWRGIPFVWAEAERVSGLQEIELWPVPDEQLSLDLTYYIRPDSVTTLSAVGDIPIVDGTMLMFAAQAEAARMLMARTGDETWSAVAAMYQTEADKAEDTTKHEDTKAYGIARVVGDTDMDAIDLSQFAALRQGQAFFQSF